MKNSSVLNIILFILLQFVVFSSNAEERLNSIYSHWNALESDSLYNLGKEYLDKQQRDSALICFSICGNKATKEMPYEQKSNCIKALTFSARLYFCFYDYDKACQQLIKAIKLCDDSKMDKELTGIYMEQGALMMTYAQQRPKKQNFKEAEDAYRKAFWNALKHEQYSSLITALFNLGNRFYSAQKLDEIQEELDAFNNANIPPTEKSYDYILNFHHALCQIADKNYPQARYYFNRQLQCIPDEFRNNILKFQVYANITKSFVIENNTDSAIYYEELMYDLATKNNMIDARTLSASALSGLYATQGDSIKSSEYSFIALQLKDSLLSVNNLDEVNSLNFIRQLHEEETRLNSYKSKNQWLIIGLIIAVIAVIIILCLWFELKKRHKNLTLQNITKKIIKYENSSLEDSTKHELKEKISHILTQTDTIYNQDFCLGQLAELCNSKSKYVSQVINEFYGQNFTSLINSLRIEEACRRMTDKENYGTWTLEGIAQSVGFKSRVTFYNAFKKHKEMSPSEYMQQHNS